MSLQEKGGPGCFIHTTQGCAGLNHDGEIMDGKVGRNNRLTFREAKACAFHFGFKRRLVVLRHPNSCLYFPPCLAFPGPGLILCDNRLFRPTTDSDYPPNHTSSSDRSHWFPFLRTLSRSRFFLSGSSSSPPHTSSRHGEAYVAKGSHHRRG